MFSAIQPTIAAPSDQFPHVLLFLAAITVIYDVVELRILLGGFRQTFSLVFLIYTGYHLLIGLIAAFAIDSTIQLVWLKATVAAISTETILSNTDIRIGGQSLLPIVEQFRRLRARMNAELTERKDAELHSLHGRLCKLPVKFLEDEIKRELVKDDLKGAIATIRSLKEQAGQDSEAFKAKLAWELLALQRAYVIKNIRKWMKNFDVR